MDYTLKTIVIDCFVLFLKNSNSHYYTEGARWVILCTHFCLSRSHGIKESSNQITVSIY